ncbi:hypothetical protein ABPG75_004748 [Micractinium tetrahymenae]
MAAATARLCLGRCRPAAAAVAARAPRSPLGLPPHGRPLGLRAAAAATQGEHPEYLVLQYDYTHHDAELLAGRERYQADHLARCREMADRGKLLLWGSVGRPIDSGLLIWRNADEAEVQFFVKRDPLVVNGLVRHWTVKPFHVHVVDEK